MKYGGEIFVSTGAFGRMDIEDMLTLSSQAGVVALELSSGAKHRSENLLNMLQASQYQHMSFLVHNYFPTPAQPFVLNLASNDPEILARSLEHCKNAISLSAALKAPFFSVHAGFCIHVKPSNLGRKLEGTEILKSEAKRIFIESLKELGQFALEHKVMLAIENNVVSANNLRRGRNDLLLGVTSEDLISIMEEVNLDSVRLLLDVAHLKVSAQTLDFNPVAAVRDIAPWLVACHLSDNDGSADTNDLVHEQSWFWKPLSQFIETPPVWVLEVYDISIDTIQEQLKLIRKNLCTSDSGLVN